MLFRTGFMFALLPIIRASHPPQILMGGTSRHDFVPVVSAPTLADLLTVHSSASIFYDYAREIESLNLRLSDASGASHSTVFVPTNSAVIALPRKPHQGQGTKGGEIYISDANSRTNVERWVAAHIVPSSPIILSSEENYETLLAGHPVIFKRVGTEGELWQQYTVGLDIRIVGKAEASNGDLYFIEGVFSV